MLEPTSRRSRGSEQLVLDAGAFREQLAYLREHSPFYREKLKDAGDARPRRARRPTTDREARAPRRPSRRTTRSAPTSAPNRTSIVRIYSTSGTSGTPSYIPLTARDLENWVTGSARSYAASGVARGPADRLHLQRGSVRRRRRPRRVRPDRPLPHPGRHRQHRAAGTRDRAPAAGGRGADAVIRRLTRRVGSRARSTSPRSSVERVLVAGEPGGGEPAFRALLERGLGRAGHRGDGDRRHRRLALGRVRGAGRHAPRRARLRPPRADRPGDRRALPLEDGATGELVLTHLRHRAAPLLRFRTRDHVDRPDGPVPLRPHRRRASAASAAPTTC